MLVGPICKKNTVYDWPSHSHFMIFYHVSTIKIFFVKSKGTELIKASHDMILVIVGLKSAVKDYFL